MVLGVIVDLSTVGIGRATVLLRTARSRSREAFGVRSVLTMRCAMSLATRADGPSRSCSTAHLPAAPAGGCQGGPREVLLATHRTGAMSRQAHLTTTSSTRR